MSHIKTRVCLLFYFISLCMLNVSSANNEADIASSADEYIDFIVKSIENQVEINEANIENNQGRNNKYIIEINLSTMQCSTASIFRSSSFNNYFGVLENELCDFNSSNSYNIVKYGLMIYLPDNATISGINGDLQSTQNVPAYFSDHKAGSKISQYERFISIFTQKLGTELDNTVFGQADEKMVTALLMAPQRNHYDISGYSPHVYNTHVYTYYAESQFLNSDRISSYLSYAKTTGYNYLGEYYHFYTRVKGFIDFFSLPDLENVSCPNIQVSGYNQPAKDFTNEYIQCKCNGLDTEQKNFLLAIAQASYDHFDILQKEDDSFDCNDPDNPNYWYFYLIDQFVSSGASDWMDWLLDTRIMGPSNLNDINFGDITIFMKYLSITKLQQLNNEERTRLIDVHKHYDSTWNGQSYGKKYTLHMESILRTAKFKDPNDITLFLNSLKDPSKGRIHYLWERMNQWLTSEDEERKLINTLSDIVTKAGNYDQIEVVIDDYTDRTYMWKVGEWFSTGNVGMWKYDQIEVTSNNSVKWRCGVNARNSSGQVFTDYNHGPNLDGVSIYPDPFTMVNITYPQEVSFFSDCSSQLGCKGPARIMPAIAFAFHADKYNGQIISDAAWDIFNGVLWLVGVGEVMTAIRAGNAAKAALLGYAALWELAELTPIKSVIESTITNNYDEPRRTEILNFYNQIAAINNLAAGGLILGDEGIKFLAGYFNAKKVGGVSDDLGEMLLDNADNALEKRPDIVTKLCDKYKIGGCANAVRGIPAGQGKAALIGMLSARNKAVKDFLNADPTLIGMIHATMLSNGEINKIVMAMDDATFLRWLTDMKNSSLIQESVSNPTMVKAWKYFDEANIPLCVN